MKNGIFEKYKAYVDQNKNLRPHIELIRNEWPQNSFQYVGGQIYNGKLYSVVNSATKMMIYSTKNGNFSFSGYFSDADFKWTGGCIYDDVFYSFPRAEKSLLTYNLADGKFGNIDCPFEYEGEHHYGGACTENGIIYQPPRNTDHILKCLRVTE